MCSRIATCRWPCVRMALVWLRIFFIRHDGTQVQCRDSTDGGATWGAIQTVKALVSSAASDYFQAGLGGPA